MVEQVRITHKALLKGLLIVSLLWLALPARATILMDSELYDWLNTLKRPLTAAAGVPDSHIRVLILREPSINAFALMDGTIVFHSGLILAADNDIEVQGVLAHEIAHVTAKHHLRRVAKQQNAVVPTIVGAILGIGAVAAGAPDAGTALILGGQSYTTSQTLKHSRTHEWEADKIAVQLFQKANLPVRGLVNFFDKLREYQLLYRHKLPEYLQTHPLTQARLDAMRQYVTENDPPLAPPSESFQRIQAKLTAYTSSYPQMQRVYGNTESHIATYALSYANALAGRTKQALAQLQQYPNWHEDPYLLELTALLYVDLGDTETAHTYFQQALTHAPNNPVILRNMADNDVARGALESAIRHLRQVLLIVPNWFGTRQALGIAYGRQDNFIESRLFLAEEALMRQNKKDVALHLQFLAKLIQSGNTQQQERHRTLQQDLQSLE